MVYIVWMQQLIDFQSNRAYIHDSSSDNNNIIV